MDALGKLYSSTTIVTMNVDGQLNGISVAWITRVSGNPPMLTVSIGKTRYSYELLKKAKYFGVCIMKKSAKEAVEYFGTKSGRDVNKFDMYDYTLTEKGTPILSNSVAFVECRIDSTADAGDHILFIGEVIDKKLYDNERPMLYGEHEILQ
ncbi:MAG: flavin reductase family protein [Petrotogales bacterium]